eukprot:902293_1
MAFNKSALSNKLLFITFSIWLIVIIYCLSFINMDTNNNDQLTITSITPPTHQPIPNTTNCDEYMHQRVYITPSHAIYNPICQLLFPSRIKFLFHHKTGTVLSRNLLKKISQFCRSTHHGQLDSYLLFIGYEHFNNNTNEQQHNFTYFHFVRDPVLTIISGFHYHKTSDEGFATHNFSLQRIQYAFLFFDNSTDLTHIQHMYNALMFGFWDDLKSGVIPDAMYIDKTTKYQRQMLRNFWDRRKGRMGIRYMFLYYMQHLAFTMDLKHYGDFYGFDLDFDDEWINNEYMYNEYRKDGFTLNYNAFMKGFEGEQMKYGLYFAMIRYLFVVYPEVYEFHHNVEHKYVFQMEEWMHNYRAALNKLVDGLNLVDTVANRGILEENYCGEISITDARSRLIDILNAENPHRVRDDHVHVSRNNTVYIDVLLRIDAHICLLLKHITMAIDYEWKYDEYC